MFYPPPANVMVADSDKGSLEATHALLLEEGYHVQKTAWLNEVFHSLQQEKIDVLILDVKMTEMKGYEAIPIIRGIAPGLPIIVTTDENSPELESRVRHYGVFYYHIKSFGFEELKLAVQNAVKKSSLV